MSVISKVMQIQGRLFQFRHIEVLSDYRIEKIVLIMRLIFEKDHRKSQR